MIKKLDLGGTACYETEEAVNICLDGSDSGDEITPTIIGNYNQMPYPSNTFDEASGSCYLEEAVCWGELFRVLKPGAKAILRSCGAMYDEPKLVYRELRKRGFEIVRYPVLCKGTEGLDGFYEIGDMLTELVVRKPRSES